MKKNIKASFFHQNVGNNSGKSIGKIDLGETPNFVANPIVDLDVYPENEVQPNDPYYYEDNYYGDEEPPTPIEEPQQREPRAAYGQMFFNNKPSGVTPQVPAVSPIADDVRNKAEEIKETVIVQALLGEMDSAQAANILKNLNSNLTTLLKLL